MNGHDLSTDYPAVRAFVRGYLHEDYIEEYGSAEEAAAAFCVDATPEERDRVSRQLSALVDALQREGGDAGRFFRAHFGGAWEPGSISELAELLEILRTPA